MLQGAYIGRLALSQCIWLEQGRSNIVDDVFVRHNETRLGAMKGVLQVGT